MREEQVQNAVKFLSHPKVRGSPVMYRRSFLEKKGLTKEEIDEAFSRVPVSKLLVFAPSFLHATLFNIFFPSGELISSQCLQIAGSNSKHTGNQFESRYMICI